MPNRPISDEKKAAILKECGETHNVMQTALHQGVNERTVSKYAKAEGIALLTTRPPIADEKQAAILKEYGETRNITQTGLHQGVSRGTVLKYTRAANLPAPKS